MHAMINTLNKFVWKAISMSTRAPESAFERALPTLVGAVLIAAVCFSAKFMYDMNRATGEFLKQLDSLTSQFTRLEAKLDVLNSSYVSKFDYKELETRVRQLEIDNRK